MIRLVKIELKKLFAKKMIYIFLAIITAITLATTLLEKNLDKVFGLIEFKANAELYKQAMDSYDLKDPAQLELYVDDKTEYDIINISKNYDVYSPEHMYVDNNMRETIVCMNENEFITKDQAKYDECKKKYDEQLEFLKHFDWKEQLINEKKDVEEEIQSLEFGINSGTLTDKESEDALKVLKLSKEILDYRIEKGIPIDGSGLSLSLTSYVSSYQQYLAIDKNKNVVDRSELLNNRSIEENYFLNKYMFENNLMRETGRATATESTASSVLSVFAGGTFALLFLVLVGGSIVAEEFNKGTIKQLLLKPYNRTKIFVSKVIASILVFFLFLIAYALITALLNGIVFGEFRSLFDPVVFYDFNSGKVIEHSLLFACLERMLVILPMYLILLGVSLLMGVLTTNTAVSIIVPIVLDTGAGIINAFARSKIFAYIPTMCWNLSEFLHGGLPAFKYLKLPTSIVIDVITILVLYISSIIIFKKKDIKNQ